MVKLRGGGRHRDVVGRRGKATERSVQKLDLRNLKMAAGEKGVKLGRRPRKRGGVTRANQRIPAGYELTDRIPPPKNGGTQEQTRG